MSNVIMCSECKKCDGDRCNYFDNDSDRESTIAYEFTMASGDIDWSDCNFYGEKNGKKTWLGCLGSERTINGTDEIWTYEDIEDFARKAVAADALYLALDQCDDLLRDVIQRIPQLSGLVRVIQSQLEENKRAILKARGEK